MKKNEFRCYLIRAKFFQIQQFATAAVSIVSRKELIAMSSKCHVQQIKYNESDTLQVRFVIAGQQSVGNASGEIPTLHQQEPINDRKFQIRTSVIITFEVKNIYIYIELKINPFFRKIYNIYFKVLIYIEQYLIKQYYRCSNDHERAEL